MEIESNDISLKSLVRELQKEVRLLHNLQNDLIQRQNIQITVQNEILRLQRLATYKGKIKAFFKPNIGNLQQYSPRKFIIPRCYNKIPDLKMPPSISIVTPSFNQGVFLERTILSVIDQKYPNLEYIIQDGQSMDESVEVIQRHASSLKFWESRKDGGQSQAINLGFRYATGEIMAYLNSDDILLPGSLHFVAKYFSMHPEVDVVYGHRVLINEDDHEVGRWVLPAHDEKVLTYADYVPQETLFWRRRIWEKVGEEIDESFKFAMDWDLLLRFQGAGARFVRLPRFIGAFRVHSLQKTMTEMSDLGIKEMQLLRLRSHGRIVSENEIRNNLRWYYVKHFFCRKLYRAGVLRY